MKTTALITAALLACACTESKEHFVAELLDTPKDCTFRYSIEKGVSYQLNDCDIEYYNQSNGPGTSQRVILAFPKHYEEPLAAVVVPFYYPEAMLGYDPITGKELRRFFGIEMMRQLAQRGIASISAESYHLTYTESDKDRDDFTRWQDAADALLQDYPQWDGIGKLVHDTRLLIDLLEADQRIDSKRIGMAGHSLGGKMAFYTGCMDPRVKAILASDFGFLWDQTNWEADWYWGEKLNTLRKRGIDNRQLLEIGGCKPFFLIAGEADTDASRDAVMSIKGYMQHPENFGFFNHATGHRPTPEALDKGYDFLLRHL